MGSLISYNSDITDIEPYYRIQFYSQILDDQNYSKKWYSSKLCKDFYQAPYEINGVSIKDEIVMSQWVCPDVANITLMNNPSLYTEGDGTEFIMVVNDCETAKSIDAEHSLSTYATNPTECSTITDEITLSLSFRSKIMTQDAT